MDLLTFKILIIGFMIILISLYLHIIINKKNKDTTYGSLNDPLNYSLSEHFDNQSQQPISIQLLNQIASKLGVSVRRIQNLVFNGDLDSQLLYVSFTILDPNIIESQNGEPNSQTTATNAHNLFNKHNFIVQINGVNVKLNKINQTVPTMPNGIVDNSIYFNNHGILNIANYSQQKYKMVPTDSSLTNFFNLKIDGNYNINPVLE
jgi:hypothetical protein